MTIYVLVDKPRRFSIFPLKHTFKLALLVVVLLAGCAKRQLQTPNPGAVQGGLSRIESSTTTAEAQRKEEERLIQEARINQARADNKDVVIKAYRQWKAQH